jgi:hypothetical protein
MCVLHLPPRAKWLEWNRLCEFLSSDRLFSPTRKPEWRSTTSASLTGWRNPRPSSSVRPATRLVPELSPMTNTWEKLAATRRCPTATACSTVLPQVTSWNQMQRNSASSLFPRGPPPSAMPLTQQPPPGSRAACIEMEPELPAPPPIEQPPPCALPPSRLHPLLSSCAGLRGSLAVLERRPR